MDFVRKERKQGEVVKVNEKAGVTYLTYPQLEACEDILHGFSTRLGGVSKGIFASMNLSVTRGDDVAAVRENYRRIAEAIGFPYENMVLSDQTHTTNVRLVTKQDMGNGILRDKNFFDTDGLITDIPGIVLVTSYADCVPLFFFDPVHKAIGLSHSGWKGTVGRMGAQTLLRMHEAFDTNPADVIAAIGPSICVDCYEVSEDVAQAFSTEFADKADLILHAKGHGKYQLDLWKANELVLLRAGILPEHLSVTDICTCCNPELLFSHRASQGKRGNLAAFLMLRE